MEVTLENTGQRLYRLDNLRDYLIHPADVDPRNFTLQLLSGEVLGLVSGLYADVNRREVVYLEITLEEKIYYREKITPTSEWGRVVLIPANLIKTDPVSRSVFVEGLTVEGLGQFATLPRV